ncbi:MAG: hypothetical protein ACYCOY_12270 [Metallibacterium sp.]
MLLYRVTQLLDDESGIYYDATHSVNYAVAFAKQLIVLKPLSKVEVESEDWEGLTWIKYQMHRLSGTLQGCGTEFIRKYGYRIKETKKVWPISKI